jgi:uncharacterized membrane protein YuzA (DUF378 family)
MPYRFRSLVDTLPIRYLIAFGLTSALYLLILLIVGLAGLCLLLTVMSECENEFK